MSARTVTPTWTRSLPTRNGWSKTCGRSDRPRLAQAAAAPMAQALRFSRTTARRGGPVGGGNRTGGNAVEVRVTGVRPWKTVVVPPNAFVVHTRRGRAEPLHVGLGISFRYHPATDSFLVVPGAMQTILISAFCICRELQGVLVQAYVQWIIQDFSVAYRKLDFSDRRPDAPGQPAAQASRPRRRSRTRSRP